MVGCRQDVSCQLVRVIGWNYNKALCQKPRQAPSNDLQVHPVAAVAPPQPTEREIAAANAARARLAGSEVRSP